MRLPKYILPWYSKGKKPGFKIDQLLLGEPWRYQLQLRISMWGTGRRHRLQLACQAAVLWWRKNRCGISAGGTPHPPKNHKFPAMTSGTNTPGVCRASPHVPNTGLFTDPSSLSLPSLVLLPGVPSPAFSKVQILFILLHASFPNRPSSREALPLSFPHNTPLSYPTYPVCALPPDQTPREPRPTTSRLMLHGHWFTMLSPNQHVTEHHTQCRPSCVGDIHKHRKTMRTGYRDVKSSYRGSGGEGGYFRFLLFNLPAFFWFSLTEYYSLCNEVVFKNVLNKQGNPSLSYSATPSFHQQKFKK